MKLIVAARRADKTPCYEGYTGSLLWNAQLLNYDETKRDSETAERRILSMSAENVIPARRVISVASKKYIVGHGHDDLIAADVARVGYVIHEATESATIKTLAQAASMQAGTTAWAGRAWVKHQAFSEQSATLVPQHHLHFSTTEAVGPGRLVWFSGGVHLVRATMEGAGGTLVATCDELPSPVVEPTATVTTGQWDKTADKQVNASTVTPLLRVRWQSLFKYNNKAAPTFGPDDIQVAIPLGVNVISGSRLTLSDGYWLVSNVDQESGVLLCRATKQHG